MTNREKEIMQLIIENPSISQLEIAEKLGIKRSSVAVQISNLMKKGKILGKGYVVGPADYVLVVGGSNMDLSGFPLATLNLRDSNPGMVKMSAGGVGRNIAENLVRMSIDTKLVSAVSTDLYGRKILEDCGEIGIDMSHTIVSDKMSSAIYLSILDEKGDMMLALADGEINTLLTPQWLIKKKSILMHAKAIVLDANLPEETIQFIASTAEGKAIFADSVSKSKAIKLRDILPNLYALKPNKIEAEILTGLTITDAESAYEAIKILINKGVKNVCLTMGEQGIYYGNKLKMGHFLQPIENIVNATGAGDAFMAGLIYGYMHDKSLEEAVKIGSAMSVCTLLSDQTISPEINEIKIKEMVKEDLI